MFARTNFHIYAHYFIAKVAFRFQTTIFWRYTHDNVGKNSVCVAKLGYMWRILK